MPDAIDQMLASARAAAASNNWYAALALALLLPDVCGRVDFPSDGSSRRYEKWFSANLGSTFHADSTLKPTLSARDCYALRCAVLHEGSGELSSQRAREHLIKVNVTTFNDGDLEITSVVRDDVLWISAEWLIEEVCNAVQAWAEFARGDAMKKAAIDSMLTISPSPFSLSRSELQSVSRI